MTGDMPTFAASNYTSTAYGLGQDFGNWGQPVAHAQILPKKVGRKAAKIIEGGGDIDDFQFAMQQNINQQETTIMVQGRRLVQVIIVDTNENVPLDKCLLYKGDPKLTDATDQELFFEIDIKQLLSLHNEERVKMVDKKVKERTEYLEAAKVRDLKMVVVNIATF